MGLRIGGRAKIPHTAEAAAPAYGSYLGGLWSNSAQVYDLTGSFLFARCIAAGFMGAALILRMDVIKAEAALNNRLTFFSNYDSGGGEVFHQASRTVNGTVTGMKSVYSAPPPYLRIREAAGTIYWDTSNDGATWTNFTTFANPFVVTSVIVRFTAYYTISAGGGAISYIDNVNALPVTTKIATVV